MTPDHDATNVLDGGETRKCQSDDMIFALGSATVYGGSGGDVFQSRSDGNTRYGNQNDDATLSGNAMDFVFGGEGDHFLDGSSGGDVLYTDNNDGSLKGGNICRHWLGRQ